MKKYRNCLIILLIVASLLISICFIPISASRLIPTFENQIAENLGVNVHIEKLILRIGPMLKIKSPTVHVMYKDGQKFAQLDNVKFYVPWQAVLSKKPLPKIISAKKIIIRVNSDDKYLPKLLDNIKNQEFSLRPNIYINNYEFAYLNKNDKDIYLLKGQSLEFSKIVNYKNYKIDTKGDFYIDNKKYINYDISILPKFNIEDEKYSLNINNIISQIKELDFHSDIIADLKLYHNSNASLMSSGFINVDNISVLDNTGKNPKSFIYLTLLGDKASVLSNIYTSIDKKIYIEGMVKNSKKPYIDIKVRTDEIELKDLFKKLKIFADFSRFKSINNLEGILNANFALKGDLNKIKSNGYLKIKNADIVSNSIHINKINSEIDFSNNEVNIINATGYVNNQPLIAKGHINKNLDIEVIMDMVELKYLMPSSFGIKKGVVSLVANLTGTLNKVTHKEILQIDNLEINNKNTNLIIESLKIDTNKNNTAYVKNIICKMPNINLIKIPSLRILIERDVLKIPETSVYMPNSKIMAKSEITNYSNNDTSFLLNIDGIINSVDIKNLAIKPAKYPLKITLTGNKKVQNIIGQLLVEKADILDEPTIVNLIAKYENKNLKLEDFSILGFSGKFSNDYKSNIKGQKKLVVNGAIENICNPNLKNIRIYTPQLLNLNLMDMAMQIKGDLFINGSLKKSDIVGQVSIQNLYNHVSQLYINNCVADFNKSEIILNIPSLKVADSAMSINATIYSDLSDKIKIKNINIKSKYLNTDSFLMYKDTPFVKNYKQLEILDGKFYSEKVQSSLYGSSIYMTPFSSDIKLKNNILAIKNITSEMYNGKLAGSVDYNLNDESYSANIMARGVSASPILNIISNSNDSISGTMDFDANISGNLISKNSINGAIKFIVKNGRMSTLGKLEHLIYAQNIVADNMLRTSLSVVLKAISLKDTGLFKFLRGDILMHNGVANIKMLQSQGPLMSLFIKGFYYTDTNYAKLTVLGRVSDEVINGLGAFGEFSMNKLMVMLTGENPQNGILPEDYNNIPPLNLKNTKEFRSIINGIIDKPSSVASFNWISYSQKSLRQKDVSQGNANIPSFIDELPY